MRHLDLFSGIGGFALAVDAVWENAEHIFCDNDYFCQQVLKKNYPNSQIYGDIRTITADTTGNGCNGGGNNWEGRQVQDATIGQTSEDKQERDRRQYWFSEDNQVDLITGGFPCQPFSQAGRRRGTEDDRHLWPEMFRVIRLTKPQWVIAENVRGLVTWNEGLVLEQVCSDLESEGYEVQPFIIPAVAVNAPHRRDRVWIVAHRIGTTGGRNGQLTDERGETSEDRRKGIQPEDGSPSPDNTQQGSSNAPDARLQYGEQGNEQGMATDKTKRTARPTDAERQSENAPNAQCFRLECPRSENGVGKEGRVPGEKGSESPQTSKIGNIPQTKSSGPSWDKNWVEVATELCRVDDGLSKRLVRLPDGRTISRSKWRQEALKAYGNAIVPQVAMEILKAIKNYD